MMEQTGLTAQKSEKTRPILEIDEKTRAELTALFRGEEWNGEKLPPVYLKYFSASHETAEDAKDMEREMKEADIFMPEIYGWDSEILAKLRMVSDGKENIPGKNTTDFSKILRGYFFDTKKQIVIIDVPEEEVLDHPDIYPEYEFDTEEMMRSSYEQAAELLFQDTVLNAEIDLFHRESHMAAHFAEKIKEAVSMNPDLRKKTSIKVLMILGVYHSAIYHEMKKLGGNHVSRNFSRDLSFGYAGEIARRFAFGKETSKEMKEEALCELLFENGLYYYLEDVCQNTTKNLLFSRYLASLFSLDEKRALFEQWKTYHKDFEDIVLSVLRRKNIVLPQNEEEMDVMLAKTSYGKYQKILKEKKQHHESEQK
ncbi:MAG: hypothetical protein WC878_03340 [Candidatus Paceibacterota bacterium]|jgi:hypothetical protein